MEKLPGTLLSSYKSLLVSKNNPQGYHGHYSKWLRFYLDFCNKYNFNESKPQSLSAFFGKLKEKKQTAVQQKQADLAIRFYYELIRSEFDDSLKKSTPKQQSPVIVKEKQKSFQTSLAAGKFQPDSGRSDRSPMIGVQKGHNEKWNVALNDLANEIKVRHYSPKTMKSYSACVRKLQFFCKSKDPADLSTTDVKDSMTMIWQTIMPVHSCLIRSKKSTKTAPRNLFGSGFFLPKRSHLFPRPGNNGVIISMKPMFKKPSSGRSEKLRSPSEPRPIPSATVEFIRLWWTSHLLQANYDIRTIQELLGHSDVRTTMIYTHTVKSLTIKEAKSPLDFD